MSNPDKTSSSSSIDILPVAFPISILFLMITLVLFQFKYVMGGIFPFILWLVYPIVGYIICVIVNILMQYMSCKKTDVSKAFLGGLSSLVAIFVGLGISSISFCRIPVASVFAPLIIGNLINVTKNSLKNSNSKECCTPHMSLESIEERFPIVSGISHGFYLMFSVIFGLTIGNGISAIC